uniref:Uncharacterized protein n=1 Tax=Chromera velia CCMP2878 TaxID=1169474 RepID=A0A0G4G2E6_9ALVE|eukprot:Cvel_19956.t1-p1 / transcript=Cvel_19956.t1 / gene=Cvel_19956 / organism=Chromera_velia_CCMP2878 / gene_product=hypothetical protein / transcript_product=hypothetical protein / location=Cvel_scaffold1757:8957-9385(-) / protein_length=143 / sequence_SO=supercontig / SO=protein_coding / is_pseudo=false
MPKRVLKSAAFQKKPTQLPAPEKWREELRQRAQEVWPRERTVAKLKEILISEAHHIKSTSTELDGDGVPVRVLWCPRFVTSRDAYGGTATAHHACRVCKRHALHLLGKHGRFDPRWCLECGGASGVPAWYFHDRNADCSLCGK